MSLFSPPPLPPQRRPAPPPSVAAATGSVGTAAGTSTAQAFAPFGAGTAAATSTAAAVGAALASGVGSSSGTGAATGSTNNIFPLTVSADGRYLKQSDGTPFLICADTTWSLAVDIPLSDLNNFLNTIVGQGFNGVSMNIIEHKYSVVNPPKERGGNLPFTKRVDAATYTGSPNGNFSAGGTQGQFSTDDYTSISTQCPDFTFPNSAYWAAVETILDACLSHGCVVFAWPGYIGFNGNDEGWMREMVTLDGITGAGGFTGQPWANAAKSKLWNYGAWLGDRWKAYPHLIWVMGGDYGTSPHAFSTQQQQDAVSHLMEGIKSVSGQASTFFTAHWDRGAIATDLALAAGSFDLNAAYCDESVAENNRRAYAHTPVSPAFMVEYFYELDAFGGSAPYRKYMYWGFLGAIAGGFFGHEQLWRFDDGTPGTDYTTIETTQATLDASRQFVLWKTLPWHRLRPNGLNSIGTLITAGGGTASPQSTDYVAAAATPEGDLLLAYVPPAHSGSVTVDMTKMNASARARWFDPANATFTAIGVIANTGTHAFTVPGTNSGGQNDFLLVLDTSAGTAAGTSTASAAGAALASGAGSSAGTSSATAVGRAIANSAGTAAGTSSASAISSQPGVGSSAGSAGVAGVGASLASGAGALAGTSSAAAVGRAIAADAGTSAGIAAVSGAGASLAAGAGASAGLGALAGAGGALAAGVGSSAGTSTAAAVGTSTNSGQGVGSAAASSSASGVGRALTAGVGSSAGTSTATAGSPAPAAGAGAAAGTASGIAVGRALAASVGTAAATSTALAIALIPESPLDAFSALVDQMDQTIIDLLG